MNGEIISADSMQIYRHMDIGTAKPTALEIQNIKHYMIDEIEPYEKFNTAIFKEKATQYIKEIYNKNKLPILIGGTGLYISSLIDNIEYGSIPENPSLRKSLFERAENEGYEKLHSELRQIDPKTAEKLHTNDIKRIVRAIEVYTITKKPQSIWIKESRLYPSPYNHLIIGLNFSDRELLYNRINQRVDKMIESGLENEVKKLYEIDGFENSTASQAIGYKELKYYLNNKTTLTEATDKIKQESRRYAKRQLTWFSRMNINWFLVDKLDYNEILNDSIELISKILD